MAKDIKHYTDEYGFIGHIDYVNGKHYATQSGNSHKLEFGDGVQRTFMDGMFKFYKFDTRLAREKFARSYLDKAKMIEIKDHWSRHWDRTQWWGSDEISSYDNFMPMLLCLGMYAPYSAEIKDSYVPKMLEKVWARGGFMWNFLPIWFKDKEEKKRPDWMPLWVLWSFHIRCRRKYLQYPVLLILDWWQFFSSLIIILRSHIDPTDCNDDKQLQLILVFQQEVMWTPVTWVTKWIYKLCIGRAGFDRSKMLPGYRPKTRLDYYFRQQAAPPLNEEAQVWYDKGLI